jgi:CHASE1-domain containing sensor protein
VTTLVLWCKHVPYVSVILLLLLNVGLQSFLLFLRLHAQIDFESDCHIMVNAITNSNVYINELNIILSSCRSFVSSNAS